MTKNIIFNENTQDLMKMCNFTMADVKKLYEFEVKIGLTSKFTSHTIKWLCKNYLLFKEKLEVQKNKSELVAENEAMKDTIAVVLAQKSNVLKSNEELRKENQQLKQQLSDEEKSHDLCIDRLNEECEKLRKQIKFESDARERFKQLQNEKAFKVLEDLKDFNRHCVFGNIRTENYINDKIKELRINL